MAVQKNPRLGLVLPVCVGKAVLIGEDITVRVVRIGAHSVRLAIDAPRNIRVDREGDRTSKSEVR
jgi:carbon storage regulator CsrA